jgi:hypothetical protein
MINIPFPIEDSVYKKMRVYSEIKWSEWGILTMLASENVLKKDWDNKNDERWNNV